LSKLIVELIDNNVDLLDVNKLYIVKTKERFARAKNRKSTIIRTKKTKTKFIKRDLSNFKHVDKAIKVSRDNKDAIERDNNRDKARQRKEKKLKANIIVAINANIQVFNKNMDKIYEDIRNIITRQTTKTTTKKTTTIFAIFAIFAIIKTIIKKII